MEIVECWGNKRRYGIFVSLIYCTNWVKRRWSASGTAIMTVTVDADDTDGL